MSEDLDRYIDVLEEKLGVVDEGRYTPSEQGINISIGLAVAEGLRAIEARLGAIEELVAELAGYVPE